MDAWLFDCYPHPRTSHLVVWIKHGDNVTRRLVPYQPDFCIQADNLPLEHAQALLAKDSRVESMWRDRSATWLRGPLEEVLRVKPKRFQDMRAIATDLRRATKSTGFLFLDVDHQPESQWMHSRGLWSMCRLHVGVKGPELRLADGEDRWSLHYPSPGLRTAWLSVETQKQGPTQAWSDPLVAVTLAGQRLECRTPGDAEIEREALIELDRCMQRADPDVIFTRHGDRFDVPYLLRRIQDLGLRHQVRLGRDPDPHPDHPDQESKSLHTYGRWLHKSHAYYLRGRWHIDLAKKTLDSEDDRKDIHGILYLTRTSNRRAQDVNRNGAGYALQQMQIDHATDLGAALPWKRNLTEDWKDAATLCAVDRGGQIMVPTPGIYEDVVACDFSGYYPSLVVQHNLSSDTINCQCCPDGPLIPELGYHVCQKVQGHQSEILRRLWGHRRWVKAILRQARHGLTADEDLIAKAGAIKSEHKALGVVCFGYFRYRNARYGCAEVHQAIQAYGRQGMTRAREVAQEEGYVMVHAMTDCTFLQRPRITRQDATRLARRITQEVGVPMDVEGIYKWIVFLPSKVHSHSERGTVGVPNRYYGKFLDGTLKVRGIEVQRHSTPDWVYDVQQGMLDALGHADDAAGFMVRIPHALAVAKEAAERLRCREVDAKDLGIMVQATRSVEEYRASTNTQTALRRLRDAGTERRPGEYVKYVVARKEGPRQARVVPVELFGQGSSWFKSRGVTYHVEHYLRLLARSVETLLAPFGYNEEDVLNWLAGRAGNPKPPSTGHVDLPERPEWSAA